jgi:hypothetical protein
MKHQKILGKKLLHQQLTTDLTIRENNNRKGNIIISSLNLFHIKKYIQNKENRATKILILSRGNGKSQQMKIM